jgi:hypothetical protein
MTQNVCAFCGKREDEAEKLIRNGSVLMCHECIQDIVKTHSTMLRDWSRLKVRGVEFDWCAFKSVVPTSAAELEPAVFVQVHRVGDRDGVGRRFEQDIVPTEAHAIETIEAFAELFFPNQN